MCVKRLYLSYTCIIEKKQVYVVLSQQSLGDFFMCFGKRLELLRKEKNIKQCDLANTIGLTQQTISSYEKGKNKPSIDILLRLANELDVSSDYLLYGNVANKELTEEQRELLFVYDKIPKEKKNHAKQVLNTFIDKRIED